MGKFSFFFFVQFIKITLLKKNTYNKCDVALKNETYCLPIFILFCFDLRILFQDLRLIIIDKQLLFIRIDSNIKYYY